MITTDQKTDQLFQRWAALEPDRCQVIEQASSASPVVKVKLGDISLQLWRTDEGEPFTLASFAIIQAALQEQITKHHWDYDVFRESFLHCKATITCNGLRYVAEAEEDAIALLQAYVQALEATV